MASRLAQGSLEPVQLYEHCRSALQDTGALRVSRRYRRQHEAVSMQRYAQFPEDTLLSVTAILFASYQAAGGKSTREATPEPAQLMQSNELPVHLNPFALLYTKLSTCTCCSTLHLVTYHIPT